MLAGKLERLVDGLAFPEALRWADDSLWFSDVLGSDIYRVTDTGTTLMCRPCDFVPVGLGWTPEGELLVVDSANRQVKILDPSGSFQVYADLGDVMKFPANELLASPSGLAWIGGYGYDPESERPSPSELFRINVDRSIEREVDGLVFPNGMALESQGRLVVSETFADRLAVIERGEDGGAGRVLQRLDLPPGSTPDGLDVDARGGIWVASAYAGAVLRMDPGGSISRVLEIPGQGVYDCSFGGKDGRTLYIAVSDTDEEHVLETRPGVVWSIDVDIPGLAWA